jgi:hypothetical protein
MVPAGERFESRAPHFDLADVTSPLAETSIDFGQVQNCRADAARRRRRVRIGGGLRKIPAACTWRPADDISTGTDAAWPAAGSR